MLIRYKICDPRLSPRRSLKNCPAKTERMDADLSELNRRNNKLYNQCFSGRWVEIHLNAIGNSTNHPLIIYSHEAMAELQAYRRLHHTDLPHIDTVKRQTKTLMIKLSYPFPYICDIVHLYGKNCRPLY